MSFHFCQQKTEHFLNYVNEDKNLQKTSSENMKIQMAGPYGL
jgi:hypothetical protein